MGLKTSSMLFLLALFAHHQRVEAYQDDPLLYGSFPDDFVWALATASYQIEGAWDEDAEDKFLLEANGNGDCLESAARHLGSGRKLDSMWPRGPVVKFSPLEIQHCCISNGGNLTTTARGHCRLNFRSVDYATAAVAMRRTGCPIVPLQGKSESIWDTFTHAGGHIDDGSSGDVACDSYHKWEEDIALLVEMGVTHYRFSIAWTRVIPGGTGEVNQLGVDYYNKLIDGLLAAGIEPMVTLYHWDLPQVLQDQGGWLNPSSAEWFEEYAAACFAAFGDRVKLWITFNEPWVVCVQGYGIGDHAPGYTEIGTYPYQCAHNILRSHGRAYRRYEQQFSADQAGRVGITLNINAALPASDRPEDVEAANREMQFNIGWFAHAIFKNGNYPQVMIDRIGEKSEAQGLPESRLPTFTQEEMDMILGTADFLGINHYTAQLVADQVNDPNANSYFADHDTNGYFDPTWYPSASSWLKAMPQGFRALLNWLKDEYDNQPIYVTENGFSDHAGNLDDLPRIYYYKHYINNLLKAITLDGCNVKGYTAWSLMDNFEWARGYTEKFGIHAVDFNDPERPRTLKASGKFYRQIISDNGFVENPSCPYYDVMTNFLDLLTPKKNRGRPSSLLGKFNLL